MLKFKSALLSKIVLSAVFISSACGMDDPTSRPKEAWGSPRSFVGSASVSPNFDKLEALFPIHFAGFKATPFALLEQFRDLKQILQPLPALKVAFEQLSTELDKYGEQFATIKKDVDQIIETPSQYTLLRYVFCLARVALWQAKFLPEEDAFFKGAGFSMPYGLVKCGDFEQNFSTYEEFLGLVEEHWDDSGHEKGDFRHIYLRLYTDGKDTVKTNHVMKGPFAEKQCPLVGSDVLGFFYLAWTYFQGIHPIPIPLEDNRCELHGIPMSRWAKVCHDFAHSEADTADFNAEQFANYLLNSYAHFIREKSKEFQTADRKHYSLPLMIPHLAEFAMSIHNLYHDSIMAILRLSLEELNPLQGDKLPEFEAFSVAACIAAHERLVNLSHKYGQVSTLEELLTRDQRDPSVTEKTEDNVEGKEELASQEVLQEVHQETFQEASQEKPQENLQKAPLENLFQTSFITGVSPLTDEEIFNLVKVRPKTEFLGVDSYDQGEIDEGLICDSTVDRNEFYIDCCIKLVDGGEYLFRQATNYSRLLNFNHDLSFLKPAEVVLKRVYNYALPVIPQPGDFTSEAQYEEAVETTGKALDTGWKHLLDFWQTTAIKLSRLKLHADAPSIAEKFEAGYQAAFQRLQAVYPWPEHLAFHIKNATSDDVTSLRNPPTFKFENEKAPENTMTE